MDAEIGYDKKTLTYYYKNDFDLEIKLSIRVLKDDEVIRIYGGHTILEKNSSVPYFETVQVYI
jgi:hypothetical protein